MSYGGDDKGIIQELSRNIWTAMFILPIVILNVLQWRRCVDNRKDAVLFELVARYRQDNRHRDIAPLFIVLFTPGAGARTPEWEERKSRCAGRRCPGRHGGRWMIFRSERFEVRLRFRPPSRCSAHEKGILGKSRGAFTAPY